MVRFCISDMWYAISKWLPSKMLYKVLIKIDYKQEQIGYNKSILFNFLGTTILLCSFMCLDHTNMEGKLVCSKTKQSTCIKIALIN